MSFRIAIFVRKATLDRCTGKGCLNAFFQRIDAFADYDEQVQLIAFTHEEGDLQHKIANLKKHRVDVVHLSTCLRAKSADYEALAERLSHDFEVVGYTHGGCEGKTRQAIKLQKATVQD
ncbi:MAG: CGGC domain-containing protein [Desulfuromonadales bacterium]|nr:CGGC domain-containing protein [Desulfuromonadales bacterium]